MNIAILTGGGDVPGLNSAIKGLTLGALARGWKVWGIRNGWQGILSLDPASPESLKRWLMPLDSEAVRCIDRDGGTVLHSARTNPSNVKQADLPGFLKGSSRIAKKPVKPGDNDEVRYDCTPHVLDNLAALKIDVLFPIGGDDTLSYGERLYKEGFQVIGIPKTMDNDVHGTDYCLGFATAVSRSVRYLHQLRTSAGSHERFAIVEVMGRNCGATALMPAYLASLDHAVIAEVPFNIERLAELMLASKKSNPSGYSMMTISEGAVMEGGSILEQGEADAYGHRKLGGIGQLTGEHLKKLTGVGVIYQNLGYLVRSGPPDPLDLIVTFSFAQLAIELAAAKRFGQLVRLHDGCYGSAPMSILSEGLKRVDVAKFYDKVHYRPKLSSALGMPMYWR